MESGEFPRVQMSRINTASGVLQSVVWEYFTTWHNACNKYELLQMDPCDLCVGWNPSTVSWQFLSSQTKTQLEKAIKEEIRLLEEWIDIHNFIRVLV